MKDLENKADRLVSDSEKKNAIWVFPTVLPGPKTGQTLTAQRIFDELKGAKRECIHIPIYSRVGKCIPGLATFIKGITTCMAAVKLRFLRVERKVFVYYCPNAGLGMWFDWLFMHISGVRYQFVIHHHVASYLNRPTAISRHVFKKLPAETIHLFSCRCLKESFVKSYGIADTRILPLTFMASEYGLLDKGERGEMFTIGHLSNLSASKGLDRVLNVSGALNAKGYVHKLVLAGPVESDADLTKIMEAKSRNDSVEYLGAVYGRRKEDFFRSLDLFLFPTLYVNETWGLVVTEATAMGIPSLVTDIACVGSQVLPEFVLDSSAESLTEDLLSKTISLMRLWRDDTAEFNRLCRETRSHFETLLATAQAEIDNLTKL